MATARDDALEARPNLDTDSFRLRPFIDRLIAADECEVVREPRALARLAERLEGNGRAVLFTQAGPEKAALVGNVCASRKRLAMAFGCEPAIVVQEVLKRIRSTGSLVEVARDQAPVQQIVLQGAEADLTRLPVHFQHGLDGAPYISASMDVVRNPETGETNIGMRRMMLRGPKEAGVDLNAPSDLRAIYEAAVRRKQPLPIAFVVGSHPIDHVAATMRVPGDELALLAALRGQPTAVVKCVSSEIRVPADGEMVIEGYLDERGYVETEGPFGEFLGYYGVVKRNPVFHLTAITMRQDALFQTSTISGKRIDLTDTAQLNAIRVEAMVWRALESAVREPIAVYATPSSGGGFNTRVALRQRNPGEARNAIAAVFASLANVKNVFVVDDDIDVFSDAEIDWALATRFQADRDMVIESGYRAIPLDPSLGGKRTGAKAGFDLTLPFGQARPLEYTVSRAPSYEGRRFAGVREALADGPKTFEALMAATASEDGREIVRALDEIRKEGRLDRDEIGAYRLAAS